LQYAEFRLSACGDYDGYKRSCQLASQIDRNKELVTDPILRTMAMLNPRILRFLSAQEGEARFSASSVVSSFHGSNASSSVTIFRKTVSFAEGSETAGIQGDRIRSRPVASYVTQSLRAMPFTVILHYIVPVILFIGFLSYAIPYESSIIRSGEDITIIANDVRHSYLKSVSLMHLPTVLSNDSEYRDLESCLRLMLEIPVTVFHAFTSIPIMRDFATPMIVEVVKVLSRSDLRSSTECESVQSFTHEIEQVCNDGIISLNSGLGELQLVSQDFKDKSDRQAEVTVWVCIFVLSPVTLAILTIIVLCFQINTILESAAERMASHGRLARFLFQRSEEAWELLRDMGSSSDVASTDASQTAGDNAENSQARPVTGVARVVRTSAFSLAQQRRSVNFDLAAPKWRRLSGSGTGTALPTIAEVEASSENRAATESPLGIEGDPIDQAILAARSGRSHLVYFFLYLFAPLAFLILIFLILFIPIAIEDARRGRYADSSIQMVEHARVCALLVENIYETVREKALIDTELFREFDEMAMSLDSSLTEYYTAEDCYALPDYYCVSIRELITGYSAVSTTIHYLEKVYLPLLSEFGLRVFNDLRDNAFKEEEYSPFSSDIVFAICFSFIGLCFVLFGLVKTASTYRAFNSLFHWPSEYFGGSVHARKIIRKQRKIENWPSNAIFVTVTKSKDEICSISDNSKSILLKPSFDFVGLKMSETFPVIDELHREYMLPDCKTKRRFRATDISVGTLLKVLLVEEQPLAEARRSGLISPNSLSSKLISFMPAYFATKYSDEDISDFTFSNAFLLLMRLRPSLTATQTDRIFNVVNQLAQNFKTVYVYSMEGGTISFVTESGYLVPLLFIRDALQDCSSVVRGSSEGAVFSFILRYVERVRFWIIQEKEPFLTSDFDDQNNLETALYQLKAGYVGFDERTMGKIPVQWENLETLAIKARFSDVTQNVGVVPFSEIKKMMGQSFR
jgi:hypothetical protein